MRKLNEIANRLEKIFQQNGLIKNNINADGLEKIEALVDLPVFKFVTSQTMLELIMVLSVLYSQCKNGNLKYVDISLNKIKELVLYNFNPLVD